MTKGKLQEGPVAVLHELLEAVAEGLLFSMQPCGQSTSPALALVGQVGG